MNYYNTPFPTSKTYPLSPVAVAAQSTHPRVAPVLKRCATKLASMGVSGVNHVTYTRDLVVQQLHSVGKRSAECDQIGLSGKAGVYIAHTDDGRKIYVGSTNNLRERIQQHINERSERVTARKVFGEEVIGLMVIELNTVAQAKQLEMFINDMMDYTCLINKNKVKTKTPQANAWDRDYNNQPSAFFLEGKQLTLNTAKQLIFHARPAVYALEFQPEANGVRNLHVQWGWFERLQDAITKLNANK